MPLAAAAGASAASRRLSKNSKASGGSGSGGSVSGGGAGGPRRSRTLSIALAKQANEQRLSAVSANGGPVTQPGTWGLPAPRVSSTSPGPSAAGQRVSSPAFGSRPSASEEVPARASQQREERLSFLAQLQQQEQQLQPRSSASAAAAPPRPSQSLQQFIEEPAPNRWGSENARNSTTSNNNNSSSYNHNNSSGEARRSVTPQRSSVAPARDKTPPRGPRDTTPTKRGAPPPAAPAPAAASAGPRTGWNSSSKATNGTGAHGRDAATTPPRSRGATPPPPGMRGTTPTRGSWRAGNHEEYQKERPPAGADPRRSSKLGGEAQGVFGGPSHQPRHSQSSQANQDETQPIGTRFARSKNVHLLKKEADFYDRALKALKYTSHDKDLKLAEDILQDKRLFRRDAEPDPWAPLDVRLGETRDMPVERVMMRGAKAKLGGHYGYIVGKLREPRRRQERDEYDEGCGAELQERHSYSPAPAAGSRSITPPGQRGSSPRKGRGAMCAFPDRCLRYREGVGARAAMTPWLAEVSHSHSPARPPRSPSSRQDGEHESTQQQQQQQQEKQQQQQQEQQQQQQQQHHSQPTRSHQTSPRSTHRTTGRTGTSASPVPTETGRSRSPSQGASQPARTKAPALQPLGTLASSQSQSQRSNFQGPDLSPARSSTARSGLGELGALPGEKTARSEASSFDHSGRLGGLTSMTRETGAQNLNQTSVFGTTIGSSSPGPDRTGRSMNSQNSASMGAALQTKEEEMTSAARSFGGHLPAGPSTPGPSGRSGRSGRSVSPGPGGSLPSRRQAASPRAESVAGSESAATTLASVLLPAPSAPSALAAPSQRDLEASVRSRSRSAPVSPAASHRPLDGESTARPFTSTSVDARSRATSRESRDSRSTTRDRAPSILHDLDHEAASRHRPWLLWEEMQIKRELERQQQRAQDAIEKPAAGQVTHLFHYHVQHGRGKENIPNAKKEAQEKSFQSAKVAEALNYPDNFRDEANRTGLSEAEANFRALFSRKGKYAGEPVRADDYLGAASPSSSSRRPAGLVPRESDQALPRHGKLRQEFQGKPGAPPVRAGVGLALDPRPNDPPYPLQVCASRKGAGVFADGFSEECARLAVHRNPGMYRYAAENVVPPRARSLPPADSAGVPSEKQRRGLFEWARGESNGPLRSKSVERERYSNNSELMGAIIDVTAVARDDARLREERLARDKPFADLCHLTAQNTQKMNEDMQRLALREKGISSAKLLREMAWE